MRRFLGLALLCSFVSGWALTPKEIREKLTSTPYHEGSVTYEVWLPSAADPVKYSIHLTEVLPGDTLSPSDYLIKWELPRGDKMSTGFSSYHGGDHFRYRDTRLQEYHHAESEAPFTSAGGGVQRTAQFTDLLPAYLAEKLTEIQKDSAYQYTFDEKSCTLSGTRRINGYDALEFTYAFDKKTGMPIQTDFVYNPASISEQTVTAKYEWENTDGKEAPVIDENYLISVFPDEFGKFRTSNFRAENMRGAPIPSFSYDDAQGRRTTHTRGEADMAHPAIIVFADGSAAAFPTVLNNVRAALASLPMSANVLYAFAGNKSPEGFVATDGESIVNGAQGLLTKCGVAVYPTFMLVNTDGTVEQVIIGVSDNLDTTLSQSMMLLH